MLYDLYLKKEQFRPLKMISPSKKKLECMKIYLLYNLCNVFQDIIQ
jgi:hypothetical protein